MNTKENVLSNLNFRNFYSQYILSFKANSNNEAVGKCPFHDDKHPSLSVNLLNGLFHCFACGAKGDIFTFYQDYKKCNFSTALKEIAAMQGIRDIPRQVVATFEYKDTEGNILYVKERIEPGRNGKSKEFIFKHLENDRWIIGRGGDPVPYNLPSLIKAENTFIVEGEGKADLLTKKFGLTATCFDSGAQSPFREDYIKYFQGKEKVIILPDNDTPGRAYAEKIAKVFYGKIKTIKIVNLPGLKEAEDIINWVKIAGNDKNKLLELAKVVPEWKPAEAEVEAEAVEDWPEPIPLDNYSNLPEFPVDVLPSWGQQIVRAVSETNQVDDGLTATIFLSVLSACLGKKVEIDLVSHREPCNIYTGGILPVGERKSKTLNVMTEPLYQYQAQKQKAMSEIVSQAANSHKIREARLSRLQKQAAYTDNPVEAKKIESQAAELIKEIAENPVPALPVLIADDITPEKTSIIMAENNECLSILSTEGGIFGILAGRYNDKGVNIDLFLKAHSGDPYSCHRVGRDPQTMQAPCLTICLTVQPDIIREIGCNNHFRGRGLLARFLYTRCKPQAGQRQRQIKAIPESLLNEYNRSIVNLLKIPSILNIIKLSPEGQKIWDFFYNDVEAEMKPGGDLESLKDWGSKLPGAVARIAGLLHFAEYGAEAVNKTISVGIVGDSCAIGGYFKEHALAAFGLMETDPRFETAKKILDYIKRHKPVSFKGRDVLRHTNLRAIDDVLEGLKILCERGFIKEDVLTYSGQGRPEAKGYKINPKVSENP